MREVRAKTLAAGLLKPLKELQDLIGGEMFVSYRGVPSLIMEAGRGKLSFCYFGKSRVIRMFTNTKTAQDEFKSGINVQDKRDFLCAEACAEFFRREFGDGLEKRPGDEVANSAVDSIPSM